MIDFSEATYHERRLLREALAAHQKTLQERINAGQVAQRQLEDSYIIMPELEEPEDK